MNAVIRTIGLPVAIASAQAQQSRMTPAWRASIVEVSANSFRPTSTEWLASRVKTQADREGLMYLSDAARLRAELILSDIREGPFDAAEAKTIVGGYAYPASVLRLSSEGDRLIAQVEGRARRYSFTRRRE